MYGLHLKQVASGSCIFYAGLEYYLWDRRKNVDVEFFPFHCNLNPTYMFGLRREMKIILLFNLFFYYLWVYYTFDIIYESYYTILINFYIYLQIFLVIIFQFQQNKQYLNTI